VTTEAVPTDSEVAASLGAGRERAQNGPALELDAVTARIGGRTVWADVSTCVPRGEFVAVLGPNGAGKSTLLRVVLGLLPPAAGELRVLGTSPAHARRRLSYLPQRHGFEPSLRVRGVDIVRLGLDGTRWGVPLPALGQRAAKAREDARRRVSQAIALVGAEAYGSRPIGELSGGEQQRVLIAQALVRDPELLLLDEPFEGLDLPAQQAVATLVQRVCESGVTVLIVAHDVNPVFPYLDRVIYLANGRGLTGRPADVITSDNLTRLFDAPVEVLRASDGRLVVVGGSEATSFHTRR
jgi:zinc/manganese transport system ATP-binding protein